MTEVATVTMPALSNWPNVEIAQTGQWDISTGRVTLTTDDFANAIAALDCPAIRNPVLKLGHDEPMPDGATRKRWDGEPSIGYVANMATAEQGQTIVGDFSGMPGWLGPILPSAYPDRSMEATWDFQCQLGHIHPFVITAVALLGVVPPGIGTLETLQDVADLYGVQASVPVRSGFSVSIQAKGVRMPNPRPREIAAGVTTEDIRRSFYESAGMTTWIKEFELDPLQLITVDEATGDYARVPITLSDSGVTFGDPVPVEIEYVDVAAVAASSRLVYASRDESRSGFEGQNKAPAPVTPREGIERVHKAAVKAATKEGAGMDPVKLREALGLAPEATDDDVRAAMASALPATPPADPTPTPAPVPVAAGAGVMAVEVSVLDALQASAKRGEEAWKMMQRDKRDRVIADAITCGKFAPGRREHWERSWDADPEGTELQINGLAPNLVPLQAAGFPGMATREEDETYFSLFPEEKKG